MQDLSPKFKPYKDDRLLTQQTTPQDKKAAQEHAISPPGEVKIFNQDVSSSGEIHENFRIFTNPMKRSLETARRDPRTHTPPNIVAYTDGSCTANGTTDTHAGIR